MSNLTYLNDASVLHNLKSRYSNKLIYVSDTNLRNNALFEVRHGILTNCQRMQALSKALFNFPSVLPFDLLLIR